VKSLNISNDNILLIAVHINFRIVLIGLMLYGFAMLPLTYVMSFFFDEASVGFIWLSIIYVMTGKKWKSINDTFHIYSETNRNDIANFRYCL